MKTLTSIIVFLMFIKFGFPKLDIMDFPQNLRWIKCDKTHHNHSAFSCKHGGVDNHCYSSTTIYSLDSMHGTICAFERTCPPGKYLDHNCECTQTHEACYHQDGCQVPKARRLDNNECRHVDWDKYKMNVCSVNIPADECSTDWYETEVPYIIDVTGEIRVVKSLQVIWKPVVPEEDSYMYTNDHESKFEVNGDKVYCGLIQSSDCYKPMSIDLPYRGAKHSAMMPFFKAPDCLVPIYCYGVTKVKIYAYPDKKHKEICSTCVGTCDENDLHLVLNMKGTKEIKVCGKYNCKVHKSDKMITAIPRDFHSKVSDNRMHVTAHSIDRTQFWESYVDCPVVSICHAIECFWCSDLLLNPSCYPIWLWVLVGATLWTLVLFLGVTCSSLKSVIRTLQGISVSLCNVAIWVARLINYMRLMGSNVVHRRVRQLDVAMTEVTPTKPIVKEQVNTPVHRRERINQDVQRVLSKRLEFRMHSTSKVTALPLIVAIILLHINNAKCDAPCSSMDLQTINTESCNIIQDKLVCDVETMLTIRLYSYDQTSCGYVRSDDGTILGSVKVTPHDISLKCSKESLYFTREHDLHFDTLYHCPGVDGCSKEWCHDFNNKTKLKGWSDVKSSVTAFCKLGESCAAHGCWYCGSPSCHPMRYYPVAINPNIYEVFRCAKWSPVAKFHIRYKIGPEDYETHLELIHGQHYAINSKLSVTLELSIADNLPVMTKDFITDGRRNAVLQASPPGSPISGQIGQLQCSSREIAKDLTRCQTSPNVCICNVEFDGASCDCSKTYIEPLFSGPDRLPLQIGNYYIEEKRDSIYLKAPAYGNGKIIVNVKGKVSTIKETSHDCQLSVSKLSGCYSCLKGATLQYKCISSDIFTSVMDCGDFKTAITCDTSATIKESFIRVEHPVGNFKCTAPCSKDVVSISGVFQHVSHPELSDASHIQLIPEPESYSPKHWFNGVWGLISMQNAFWLGGLLLIGFISITLLKISYSQLLKKIT